MLKLENFIEIKVVLSNTSLMSLLLDILSWVFQIPLDGPDVIKCEEFTTECGDYHPLINYICKRGDTSVESKSHLLNS